jgi:hypothetical protein
MENKDPRTGAAWARSRSVRYLRAKAEEYRAKADNSNHQEAKDSMIRLALHYDGFARSAEKIRTVKELED